MVMEKIQFKEEKTLSLKKDKEHVTKYFLSWLLNYNYKNPER